MNDCPYFHIKTRVLLVIAGCVWIIAGFNVTRLGLLSYQQLNQLTLIHPVLSLIVFSVFSILFQKMSLKHTKRITGYQEETKPIWHFFDLKAYCIMAFMMGGGIWLRSSGLVPPVFIAVFYTGLGCALGFAGVSFWYMFFRYKTKTA